MEIIEKLRKIRDGKGVFAAVLTELSKAIDCIPHQLLIAKLSAYGFDMKSVAFISVYLKKPETENKKSGPSSANVWIYYLVYQRVLFWGLFYFWYLLLIFYLNYDLDFANYVDDTISYSCGQDFSSIINVLELNINTLFNWFRQNSPIANSGKSHFWTTPYGKKSLKIHNQL